MQQLTMDQWIINVNVLLSRWANHCMGKSKEVITSIMSTQLSSTLKLYRY